MVAIGAMALISSPALAATDNPQSEEWVRERVKAVCAEDGPGDVKASATDLPVDTASGLPVDSPVDIN